MSQSKMEEDKPKNVQILTMANGERVTISTGEDEDEETEN